MKPTVYPWGSGTWRCPCCGDVLPSLSKIALPGENRLAVFHPFELEGCGGTWYTDTFEVTAARWKAAREARTARADAEDGGSKSLSIPTVAVAVAFIIWSALRLYEALS